jgi:dCMP deaminase
LELTVNNKWDKRFLQMAQLVGSWSKDPSSKIGCVIAEGKIAISSGFNGYASGIIDNPDDPRELKYQKIIHAEINAILYARRNLTGCTLYVTPIPPCDRCAPVIIQAGIKRVVVGIEPEKDISRWEQYVELAQDMFIEANVTVERFYI